MAQSLSEKARKNKAVYDTKYVMEHQVQRKIVFNDVVPEDVEMLAWLDSKPNKNQYVKDLIREDMMRSGC